MTIGLHSGHKFQPVVWILLLAGLALVLLNVLSLGQEEELVVRLGESDEKVWHELAKGNTLSREFVQGSESLKAVKILAKPGQVIRGGLTARVLVDGEAVAMGEQWHATYNDLDIPIIIDLPRFSLPSDKLITVEIERVSGEPITLQKFQGSGELALSVFAYTTTDFGFKQGVLLGIAFMLGALAVSLLPRYRYWVAGLLIVTLVPLAGLGFWFSEGELGISDWDYHFSVHEGYLRSILSYKSFPFWNPYTCGGTAGLADPESSLLSPSFALELGLGVSRGLRLSVLLMMAVGGLGMMALARRLKLSVIAALITALSFSLSSVVLIKIVEGHIVYFGTMWIPWIFWAWLGAYRFSVNKSRYLPGAIFIGGFLALMFYQGSIYALSYVVPALLLLPLFVKYKRKALWLTVSAGLWTIGLSAFKLWPAILWTRQFPDEIYAVSANTLPWLVEIFLGRHLHGARVFPDQGGGWHEYGAYVGPVVLSLVILGLAWWRQRVVKVLALVVLLTVALAAAGPLLKPILDTLPWLPRSYVSRVSILTVMALSLLAGFGIKRIEQWIKGGQTLRILLVGLVATSLMTLSYPLSQRAFLLPAVEIPLPPAPGPIAFTPVTHTTRLGGVDYDRAYGAAARGYGTLAYCTALGPEPAVSIIDDIGRTYLVVTNGQGEIVSWSPNRVKLNVESTSEFTVTINTNYADGWVANGRPASEMGGRVGTILPAGEHEIEFVYQAPGARPGLVVTVLSLLFAAWLLLVNSRGTVVDKD